MARPARKPKPVRMEAVGHISPEGIRALARFFLRVAEEEGLDIFEEDEEENPDTTTASRSIN
jgi:hypothetical protein